MQYMLHVVDQTGQYSYCRAPIMSDSMIQFNSQDQLLMWICPMKPDGSVPAWVFFLVNEQDVEPMSGTITKCLIEMNAQRMFEE